jgi:hypothetical protein
MMFVVSEAEADAIRAAFDRGGELSAAVELRRLFPVLERYVRRKENILSDDLGKTRFYDRFAIVRLDPSRCDAVP